MADFVGLLKKTIEAQPQATARLRQRIYERARATVERKLTEGNASLEVIALQQAMLQQAIDEVEAYYGALEEKVVSQSSPAAMDPLLHEKGQDASDSQGQSSAEVPNPDAADRQEETVSSPVGMPPPFLAGAISQRESEGDVDSDSRLNPAADSETDFVPFDTSAFRRIEHVKKDVETDLPAFEVEAHESSAPIPQSPMPQGEEVQSEGLRDEEAVRQKIPSLASLSRENEGEAPDDAAQPEADIREGEVTQPPHGDASQSLARELIPVAVTDDAAISNAPLSPPGEDVAGKVEEPLVAVVDTGGDVVGDMNPAQAELPAALEHTPALSEPVSVQEELIPSTQPPESAQELAVGLVDPAFLDQIAVSGTVENQQAESRFPPLVADEATPEHVHQEYASVQNPLSVEEPTLLEKPAHAEEVGHIESGLDQIFPIPVAEPEEMVSASPIPPMPLDFLQEDLPQEKLQDDAGIVPATEISLPVQYEHREDRGDLDASLPPKTSPKMDMSWSGASPVYNASVREAGKNESEMDKARKTIDAFQLAAASPPAQVSSPMSTPASEPELAPALPPKRVSDLKFPPNLDVMPDFSSAPTLEAAGILDSPSNLGVLPEAMTPQTTAFAPAAKREKRKGSILQFVAILAVTLVLLVLGSVVWFLMNGFMVTDGETPVREAQSEEMAAAQETGEVAEPAPKMTQRLLPGGRESDPGRASDEGQTGGGMSSSAGSSVVDRYARVVYIEALDPTVPVMAHEGQVEWSLSRTPSEFGGLDELSIVGTVDIPDRDMTVRLSIQRNTDVTIDAAYLFYFTFVTSQNLDGEAIDAIRLLFKASEQSEGQALVEAIPVKVRENFFVLALRGSRQALEHNLALMRQLPFLRLNIIYADSQPQENAEDMMQDDNDLVQENGDQDQATASANSGINAAGSTIRRGRNFHIGEFSIAKGSYGDSVFKQAIDDWLVKANWAPLSPRSVPAPAPVALSPAGDNSPESDNAPVENDDTQQIPRPALSP